MYNPLTTLAYGPSLSTGMIFLLVLYLIITIALIIRFFQLVNKVSALQKTLKRMENQQNHTTGGVQYLNEARMEDYLNNTAKAIEDYKKARYYFVEQKEVYLFGFQDITKTIVTEIDDALKRLG